MIVVVVIVVLALAAAFTPLGGQIATRVQCAIGGIFSGAGGAACGTAPEPVTVGPPEGGGAGGSEGGNAAGPSEPDGPQVPAQGALPQEGGALPQEGPTETVDRAKVDEALKQTREALKPEMLSDVTPGDLTSIENQLTGLNGAEVDAFIAGMTDDELRRWIADMEDYPGTFRKGGWSPERRQQMWSQVLPNASSETVRRLAGLSHDIQPRFDDVEGDDPKAKTGTEDPKPAYQESQGKPVVGTVSRSDISQGQIGDCWYIASLKAIAAADPSVIKDAITDNGNGTYTVRLYHDGNPVLITVTGDQVVSQEGKGRGGQTYARSSNRSELWPQIMEKALAAYKGSYGSIESNWPSHGMEVLTGRPSTTKPPSKYSAADLQAELDRGHAVVSDSHPRPVWFWWKEDNPFYKPGATDSWGNQMPEELVRNHSYVVTSVQLGDPNDPSDDTVTIQNPWHHTEVMTLPYEDWKNNFSEVHVNPVK